MNLNIVTEPGKARKYRVTIQPDDGTQGVFAEADDLALAIAQVLSPVLNGTSAAVFAGIPSELSGSIHHLIKLAPIGGSFT